MSSDLERQRAVARIALAASTDAGFALAGGSALREHGLSTRPTEDIDLFTTGDRREEYDTAVDAISSALSEAGYSVEVTRNPAGEHVKMKVTDEHGHIVPVDLGIDYRSQEPVTLDIGAVISLEDSVGSKVTAAFSRGTSRDFVDLDSIRESGGYTDAELLAVASEFDPGFSPEWLARGIDYMVKTYTLDSFADYDITGVELGQMKERLSEFADIIRHPQPAAEPTLGHHNALFPYSVTEQIQHEREADTSGAHEEIPGMQPGASPDPDSGPEM
ncbi:nucleotidyl transferase AbiEii/AbiGii toxin family protein [Corynebacterium kalidii]